MLSNKLFLFFRRIFGAVRDFLPDQRFVIVDEFKLKVPQDYVHEVQLAVFAEKHKNEFHFFNGAITDKNFARATQKLQPGKTYTVSVVNVTRRALFEDCLGFLSSRRAILTGAQGLSLVYQFSKEKILKEKWYLSFDQREALFKDSVGGYWMPRIQRNLDGGPLFHLGYFDGIWDRDCCLVYFSD